LANTSHTTVPFDKLRTGQAGLSPHVETYI
jgi:hypothetical protein